METIGINRKVEITAVNASYEVNAQEIGTLIVQVKFHARYYAGMQGCKHNILINRSYVYVFLSLLFIHLVLDLLYDTHIHIISTAFVLFKVYIKHITNNKCIDL